MARRRALTSLFYTKTRDTSPSPPHPAAPPPAWMWPSCKHPRTQSFRDAPPPNAAKTIASLFLDSADSSLTSSSAPPDCCSESFSTASEASAAGATADAIVRGLRSGRLFFDPPRAPTSSILQEKTAPTGDGQAFGGGVAVAFESADPYVDFRASMEEMVAAHGVADWDWLEEMLGWYLRANGKDTHSVIVAAFVDLVVSIAASACASCSSRGSSFFKLADGELEAGSGRDHVSFGFT